MNRLVSSNDLTRLSEKAWGLAKLAESAQRVSCDLDAGKRDKQDVQNAVKRCRERLHERNITKKQRRKIQRKLEFYDEWLYDNMVELKDKQSGFTEAVSQIEMVLHDLAAVYDALANVHRFEHRPTQNASPE
jgi:hypothetical protein